MNGNIQQMRKIEMKLSVYVFVCLKKIHIINLQCKLIIFLLPVTDNFFSHDLQFLCCEKVI